MGRLLIAPANHPPGPGILRLVDGPAFGTGLHPTTALCLEAIESLHAAAAADRVLVVATGSGVLAIAALMHGADRVTAIDVDGKAAPQSFTLLIRREGTIQAGRTHPERDVGGSHDTEKVERFQLDISDDRRKRRSW